MAIYDANDNILMRFEYADSRLPVAVQSGGATYYLSYDQVGSLRLVTDVSGNVIKALDYDSFGNIIKDTNPLFDMPFSFAGGMIDTDTGLIRFGFREYCSEIGRWTAIDPILFQGNDTDLYSYCLSDPINQIDSSGLIDLNLLKTGTSAHKNANNVPSIPGLNYVIGAHGNSVGIHNDLTDKRMSPKDLAEMIRNDLKNYMQGQSVIIMACNVGKNRDRDSFAQQLANELGTTVYAPDDFIWFNANGTVDVAPYLDPNDESKGPDLSKPGHWVPFRPQIGPY